MDSADQVITVLQVALTIGPVAVYFLGLGLASSQARPCLVSERSDFVLLALAFAPVMLWPMVALIKMGYLLIAFGLVTAVVLLFLILLPQRGRGWVIYNINSDECQRVFRETCRLLGWHVERVSSPGSEDSELLVQPAGLTITLHSMPWLRNVTVRCRTAIRSAETRRQWELLLRGLTGQLRRESLLPSPTGAGLVVIGATMLGLPMWYFFHHMNAIVDVVRRILLA